MFYGKKVTIILTKKGKTDMDDLTKAIAIACKAHENQKDKAGESYILHPLRLMMRLHNKTDKIVAVLHDVVEDSPYALSFLESEGFSREIIEAVDALTKREKETYDVFLERLSSNDLAVRVKIQDIRDNLDVTRLPRIDDADFERIRKYHRALSFLEQKAGMLS